MRKKGGVETPIGLILLLIILTVSVFMLFVLPVWTEMPKNQCIFDQARILNRLDNVTGGGAVQKAKLRNSVDPDYQFYVGSCIDCIWYDPANSELIVKIVDQDMPMKHTVSVPYLEIGYDCGNCNWDRETNTGCANLRNSITYIFEINSTHVKCVGMIESGSVKDCLPSTNPYRGTT